MSDLYVSDKSYKEMQDEIERLRAATKRAEKLCADRRKRITELERQLRWLKSKAFVESRYFEKPGYHWQIHFNSTCATVDNAIKKAALREDE